MLPFVKGTDLRPVEPRRIATVPDSVLDVVVGGDIATSKAPSPQLIHYEVQQQDPALVPPKKAPSAPQLIPSTVHKAPSAPQALPTPHTSAPSVLQKPSISPKITAQPPTTVPTPPMSAPCALQKPPSPSRSASTPSMTPPPPPPKPAPSILSKASNAPQSGAELFEAQQKALSGFLQEKTLTPPTPSFSPTNQFTRPTLPPVNCANKPTDKKSPPPPPPASRRSKNPQDHSAAAAAKDLTQTIAFATGTNTILQDAQMSFKYYHKAAQEGHTIAQYWLGCRYENGGDGVVQDYGKAMEW